MYNALNIRCDMKNFKENFAGIKRSCTFVASDQDKFIGSCCGSYFYGYTDAALSKDIRLPIHNGLPHSCCNLSWSTCGKVAFLLLSILIFSFMTKTMKNASKVKYSSLTSTPDCESVMSDGLTIREAVARLEGGNDYLISEIAKLSTQVYMLEINLAILREQMDEYDSALKNRQKIKVFVKDLSPKGGEK
jgi:hypothetical protein